jgi:hypothetical protein
MASNRLNFTTHKGTAVYPWINRADTHFSQEGVYKTGIRVPADQSKNIRDMAMELAKEEFGKKAAGARMPWKVDEDTGEIILNAKSKYQPKVYDSAGQVIPPQNLPEIWGGSIIRMGGTMSAYNQSGNMGVNMQLSKIQIIELADRQEGGDDGGFDAVAGGFIAGDDDGFETDEAGDKEEGFAANF